MLTKLQRMRKDIPAVTPGQAPATHNKALALMALAKRKRGPAGKNPMLKTAGSFNGIYAKLAERPTATAPWWELMGATEHHPLPEDVRDLMGASNIPKPNPSKEPVTKEKVSAAFKDLLGKLSDPNWPGKSAAEAKGIPDRGILSDPTKLPVGQLVDYVAHQHDAHRAGPHMDIRLGTPATGLHSWVVRAGLPPPGVSSIAPIQPVHDHSYLTFKGNIPKDEYGGGTVDIADIGKALITKALPDQVNFVLASKRRPEEYTLIKRGDDWRIINTTRTNPGLLKEFPKEHYKSVDPASFPNIAGLGTTSAKIDGALVLAHLLKNKMRVYSHRLSAEGLPLEKTHYIGGLTGLNVPKGLRNQVMKGELYGERGGKAIAPQELGGILNSSLAKALEDKQRRGIQLKVALFKAMGKRKEHIKP